MTNNISYLLAPKSVAILGASDNVIKAGGRAIGYMKRHEFTGSIYPVNPVRETVQGLKSYPSLEELPEVPEVVVISTAASEVEQAFETCIRLGVKAVVIYSSGFAELGEEGDALQNMLLTRSQESGVRILGPNTQGYANFSNSTILSFSTMIQESEPKDGSVAIISQSGAGAAILYGGVRRSGLGVRYMFATGNEADLNVAELLGAVLQDSAIKVAILYMESIRSPELLKQAIFVAHQKNIPVLVIKAGKTESGKQTVSSHTGSLAGEEALTDAFFQQCGAIRVADFDEAIKNVVLFSHPYRLNDRNVVTISNSGATCVLSADGAEESGLKVYDFDAAAQEELRQVLPSFVVARNPVDMTTALLGQPEIYAKTLHKLAKIRGVDAIHIGFPIGGEGYDFSNFASQTADFVRETGIPVVVSVNQDWVAHEFASREIPVFYSERMAMQGLGLLFEYSSKRATCLNKEAFFSAPILKASSDGDAIVFSETTSLKLLADAGLPANAFVECQNQQDVHRLEYTNSRKYVAKIITSEITHKSDHGLVRLNITSAEQAERAFSDFSSIMDALGKKHQGMLIAEQQSGDFELVIGSHIDTEFGAVVMVGSGGVLVEAIKDIQFLITPFDKDDAVAAIKKLRLYPALESVRGLDAVDIDGLATLLVKLGTWVNSQEGKIHSVDANPLIVFRGTKGPVVVDAVVIGSAEK